MTERELERLMCRVLLDVLRRENDCDGESAFLPSLRYQRQMLAMQRDPLKWMRRRSKPFWMRTVQKTAAVILAVCVGFGAFLTVNPDARALVSSWIKEWYETHIIYRFSGSDYALPLPQYRITDLPVDYTERADQRIEEESHVGLWYENEAGAVILLDYTPLQEGSLLMVVPVSGDVVCESNVNGCYAQLFLPESADAMGMIMWIDEESGLCFYIVAPCEAEELIRMAESVRVAE